MNPNIWILKENAPCIVTYIDLKSSAGTLVWYLASLIRLQNQNIDRTVVWDNGIYHMCWYLNEFTRVVNAVLAHLVEALSSITIEKRSQNNE